VFVTSQGSPYGRLRRALDSGNATIALSAATEVGSLGLTEALELCLLLCGQDPEKFSRAAVRWHGRYCREVNAGIEEAQAVLAALGALRGPRREAAATALADLIHRKGSERASEAVMRWAMSQKIG
jgi:hypothetical protein